MKQTKKIYFGGSFEDAANIATLCALLKMLKFECTCDWWNHTGDDMESYAKEDLEGVRNADILFVYNNGRKSSGKLVEIGIALGLGKPVYIFGDNITGVFSTMVNYYEMNRITDIYSKIKELNLNP